MSNSAVISIRSSVYAAFMTALMVVGAYIAVPLPGSPVPVVLLNLFVLLAGLILGLRWGLVSVGLYLLLGALGLPVFSAARGGLAHLVGPTGGYLIGMVPAVMITGALGRLSRSFGFSLFAAGIGAIAIYTFGVPWLMASADLSFESAIAVGVLPFVIPDALKVVVAASVTRLAGAAELTLQDGDSAW